MAPSPTSLTQSPTADRLEQRFVFRLGRMVPLGLALLAGLVGVLAIIAMAVSLVPPSDPVEPTPQPEPAAVSVTAADVAARRAIAERAAATQGQANRPRTAADTATPTEAVAIAQRLHGIRALLAEAEVPWDDQYRSICTDSYLGYCFARGQRLTARGASGHLTPVLELYDQGGQQAIVTIPEPSPRRAYTVNYSGAASKVTALDEVHSLLTDAPVGERLSTLTTWAELRTERERNRLASIAAEEARVSNERARVQAEHAAAIEQRRGWRAAALLTAAVTLGAIVTLAMLLGILAIERNTRALRERVEGNAVDGGPIGGVPVPPVTPFSFLPRPPERSAT